MPRVLVIGASRGLGLEFARYYQSAGWEVLATSRGKSALDELGVEVHRLDVTDFAAIRHMAEGLKGRPIDLLINNAGIYGSAKSSQSFGSVDGTEWEQVMRVNALAPLKVAEAFADLLEEGTRPVLALVSSKMASMGDNSSGGTYVYRASKAALNATGKSLSFDLGQRGIITVLLHPGWVRTDMGGPNGLISAQESVAGMCAVLEGLTNEDNGRFIAYDGKEVSW